jgi:hypothetical protein
MLTGVVRRFSGERALLRIKLAIGFTRPTNPMGLVGRGFKHRPGTISSA